MWRLGRTLGTLLAVVAATGVTLGWVVLHGPQGPDELTEVPLMAAMFLAMVWHTERRKDAADEVRRAAEREHEFVRAASHQLRTPIAVARGLASLVRTGADPSRADADLTDLVDELNRLSRIADDLLLLASAEQQDALLRADVDLEDLIVGAGRRWNRVENRRWRIHPCEGTIAAADRDRLDSLLDAVLENAVNATGVGDAIKLSARAEGDLAVIAVTDTGAGIPPNSLPYVFDRFWRASYGSPERRGSGLGLAIVKAIADAHHGTVTIASDLGRGTTVTIRLPHFVPAVEAPQNGNGGGLLAAARRTL
jgi:signal transduction histidine kinase